jgi:hypothetical protein
MLILGSPQNQLRELLHNVMENEDNAGGEVYYEMVLRHKFAGYESLRKFAVQHLVADSVRDDLLDRWAAPEKLFPWVALAAPLEVWLFHVHHSRSCLLFPGW